MKTSRIFLALALLCLSTCTNGLLPQVVLEDFISTYNNSQSDLLILMDESGSVSNYGWRSEKLFVESLLNEFSLAPYSTRLALITFSSNVITHINYIDIDPHSTTHQKCEFKPRFENNVNQRGGLTNMKDAFGTSYNLLQTAINNNHKRLNVKTTVIMITDGYWNLGDPRPNANTLKNDDYDIFMVGVDGYSQWQLQALASSNDHVLEFSTFTQFRELAQLIRGDAHERTFMQVESNKCTTSNGCDSNAFCGCGTVSGVYQCVCKEGYYGTGVPNNCFLCELATYKTFPSPDYCSPCPAFSTTDAKGSTLRSQCKCFVGYEGTPAAGNPCTAVQCEQILPPDNGRFLAACGHSFNDVCVAECNIGFSLTGTSSRRCQSDKTWSGLTPVCEVIRCSVLPTQNYGTMSCSGKGYEYGDTCNFSCDEGYERKGSAARTCQADTAWSGQQTTCEARLCPALRQLAFGTVSPADCVSTPQPYQRGCVMACVPGYVMTGSSPLQCGALGTWLGTYPTCNDDQPPIITCPPDVNSGTDPERPTRTVTWTYPVAQDNSELHDPNAAPTVEQDLKDITSPYDFAPGTVRITYTATDKSNNSQSCVFTVTIADNEPPSLYCPENMEIKKESSLQTIAVFWPMPRYYDNSGQTVRIFTSSVNGSAYTTGQHRVTYEATDHVGNRAECSFFILVSAVRCKPYDPPINGSLACSPFNSDELCSPSCRADKEFARVPATFYTCKADGNWDVWDFRPTVIRDMPWPDCTEEYLPGAARKGMQWQYFSGDCSSNDTQNQIKNNFIKLFNQEFGGGDQTFCQTNNLCAFDNIKVTCGATKRRRRRNTNVVTIELDVSVTVTTSYNGAKSNLETHVNNAKTSSSMKDLGLPGVSLDTVTETETFAVCIGGSVFELFTSFTKSGMCQECPAGNYFDSIIANCSKCPIDTYNTYTGQLQCVNCPESTYTIGIGSKNRTECLAPCQAGEFSSTGLANCEACPINTYQCATRQTSCRSCPGSAVTLTEGAKSIAECGMPCAAGTYSVTGAEPCLPCAKGRYQPSIKQQSCLICGTGLSTYGEGASSLSQCVDIDDCASSPCNNGGQCVNNAQGFQCICNAGFTGSNCEIEENECSSNPCIQGATCVDKVNGYLCLCPPEYSGPHCDIKTSNCDSSSCASGSTCVNSPDGHDCICPEGYGGTFCETKINDCASAPCQNGATCLNENNSYTCTCPSGYSGTQCEKNDNGCLPDSCLNGATCTDTTYGHVCECAAGFAGLSCEVNENECANSPCQNSGECVDQNNAYTCYCKPSFAGVNCETEVSTDYDLTFDRSGGRGMSSVEMRQELRAFTIAFWMKVADATGTDPGTPISYAVQQGDTLNDNALVIHDYTGFNIWVNGVKATTYVSAADDKWHHVAAAWQSTSGLWKIYKDGSKVAENAANEPFQMGQVIPAGGMFVLGQEQDSVGGNFSANEAFIGGMSQMNVWNYELDSQDIADMARHAENYIGNVVAWSDFYLKTDGGVTKTKPSAARTENRCWSNWFNNDSPSTGDGDSETRPGECPAPSLYDCQDTTGKGMNDLELNLTSTCSSSGITCLNSDQRTGRSCPDFKVRYVCSCPANSACNSNPCGQHGTCQTLPVGYQCNCNAGYEGRHCETANLCPSLGTIAYGSWTGNRNIGDTVTVSCNAGFSAVGATSLTCTKGRWNAVVASCVDVDECTAGGASCTQACVNTIGSYLCKCNSGYEMQSDGSCTDVNECNTNNGNCQQSCHNSAGSYRCMCSSGYSLMADGRSCVDTDECLSNSGLGPCEQICTNTLTGRECLCNPGYTLNSDGTTCQARSCSALPSFSHGTMDPVNPDTTVDSRVRFACNVGYVLKGAATRTCLADGTWSGLDSTCEVIRCIIPGPLQDGQPIATTNTYNTVVSYTCNSGLRLVGSASRTCQADGTWSGEHPRCIAADCPEPAVPANGNVIGLQRKVDDTIRFECDVGFRITGARYAVCQQSGSWNSASPTCPVINCGSPPAIANGQIHGTDFTYGAKVTFSCNAANFKLSGSTERTCQLDGTWSGTPAECLEDSCGDPGTPANGRKIGDNHKYHDVVTFECNEGYQLAGSSSRTCQTSGNWDGTQPTCTLINCGDPGTPDNGERRGSAFTYGNTIIYDCDPGYQISGSRSRTCQVDGKWSGAVASCVVSSCGLDLNDPSGTFSSPDYPNLYSNNAYCRWKISMPSDKKVMVTFTSFKTQQNHDVVEVYDGVSGVLITTLSGVYSKAVSFTSENNVIDIKFITDGSDTSEGFSVSYQQVTCGGVVTALDQVIMSPNYPSNYPDSITCVWSINIGAQFQLEFDAFHTDAGYDLLTGYSSLSSFTQSDLVFEIEGERFNMAPIQNPTTQMHLTFKSNYIRNYSGFKMYVRKYQIIVGK